MKIKLDCIIIILLFVLCLKVNSYKEKEQQLNINVSLNNEDNTENQIDDVETEDLIEYISDTDINNDDLYYEEDLFNQVSPLSNLN